MAMAEHQKINADEEMRILLEDREKAEFNLALIKGAERSLGRAEGKAEVALALLQMGQGIESVSKATGLSVKDLEKLRAADTKQVQEPPTGYRAASRKRRNECGGG